MRNIRVQSDGTGNDTVVTLEDGTEIKGVHSAVFWLDANEVNRVELTFLGPKMDVHADLSETTMRCPICSSTQTHYCPSELQSP